MNYVSCVQTLTHVCIYLENIVVKHFMVKNLDILFVRMKVAVGTFFIKTHLFPVTLDLYVKIQCLTSLK